MEHAPRRPRLEHGRAGARDRRTLTLTLNLTLTLTLTLTPTLTLTLTLARCGRSRPRARSVRAHLTLTPTLTPAPTLTLTLTTNQVNPSPPTAPSRVRRPSGVIRRGASGRVAEAEGERTKRMEEAAARQVCSYCASLTPPMRGAHALMGIYARDSEDIRETYGRYSTDVRCAQRHGLP